MEATSISAPMAIVPSPAKVRILLLLETGSKARENRRIHARFSLRRFRDSTFACDKIVSIMERKGRCRNGLRGGLRARRLPLRHGDGKVP